MVQAKLTNFKTGTIPSPRRLFNMTKLTPTQQLQLVYCRIWGTTIPDNFRSGMKYFRKNILHGKAGEYENAVTTDLFPELDDHDEVYEDKLKAEHRRQRIIMRGIKIGQRRGGAADTTMSIFDTKKTKH